MPEEWIVRVEGKEYGPVDADELREWKREGRLIPANELRRVGDERWIPAGEFPEIFGDEEPALPPCRHPGILPAADMAADFRGDFSHLSRSLLALPVFWLRSRRSRFRSAWRLS